MTDFFSEQSLNNFDTSFRAGGAKGFASRVRTMSPAEAPSDELVQRIEEAVSMHHGQVRHPSHPHQIPMSSEFAILRSADSSFHCST